LPWTDVSTANHHPLFTQFFMIKILILIFVVEIYIYFVLIVDSVEDTLKIHSKAAKPWKNCVALEILGEKSSKIKGGGQDMAAMMLMVWNFTNSTMLSIKPLPLISLLFHLGFSRPDHFFTAWLFLSRFHFFLQFIISAYEVCSYIRLTACLNLWYNSNIMHITRTSNRT